MAERRKQINLWKDKEHKREERVELGGTVVEHSYIKGETEGRDESIKHDKLLEQILSRENMNLAYERVIGNK